ncbi:hypothetical protein J7W08_05270 [Methanococcoides orientis]|uniref:tetratricopeptide repeat protein n=1 Tax=Methanococcoides orientis TaxID=2822137 RepID=UPI001E30BE6A|nr:tetratricopeptide repeat protein [Methanococcoides orientis]UGV41690.1 hypothetical protein J7W08_05270 [Methanococcoides orientis]
MDLINKLKDKQKDQSAKNWFDLGVQTKSLDKKVQYFTKCLLIEPENVEALRLLADAQDELGMIDAAMGSRARADDIEGSSGMFSQRSESYTESDAFGSNSFGSDSFASDTMAVEEEEQLVEDNTFSTPENNGNIPFDTSFSEPDQGTEIPGSNNEKWAIFEIAKENEAKKEEESFSTSSASVPQQETNVVVEELTETEDQPVTPETSASVPEETPTRAKKEPVVVKKQTEQRVATSTMEQATRQPAAQASATRPAPTPSTSTAVPQAIPQCSISEPVAMKLPMGEIIKFWIVGAVVLIIVGMIMNSLAV